MTYDDLFNPEPDGADRPIAGTYQLLLRGRPPQPVRILFAPPIDDDTGEPMDRSPRWQMLVNGRYAIISEDDRDELAHPRQILWGDVWPRCSGSPIPYSEYAYLVARIDHAQSHDDRDAFANPRRRIDLDTVRMPQ